MMSNEKCGSKIHVFVIKNIVGIEKEKKGLDEEEKKKEIGDLIEVNNNEDTKDNIINMNEKNTNRKNEKKEEIITHKIYYPQVKIVKVSCGKSIIGFLSIVGKIYCWHLNNFNDFDKNVPYLLVDSILKNKTIHDVSSGHHHIAFLSKDGELFTYGDNTYGQLGNNSINENDYLEEIDNDKFNSANNCKIKNQKKYKVYKVDVQNNIVKCVYSSEKYTLYLTIDGLLYGFGLINEYFIKGKMNRNKINKVLTKPHHIYTNDIAFKKISIGINFILAINFNNFIYSWGQNTNGVLGHSNCIDSYEPKKIENLKNVIFISAGKISLCKTMEEELYIWGGNYGNKPNLIKNKFDDMHINNNFIIGLCGKKNLWVKNIDNLSHGYYINNLKINLLCSYDNLIIGVENYEEENDLNEKKNVRQFECKNNFNNLNTSVDITENGVNLRNNPIDIVNNYILLSDESKKYTNDITNNNNKNINNNDINDNNINNTNISNNNNINFNNNDNSTINSSKNKKVLSRNLHKNESKQNNFKDSNNTDNFNCIKDNIVVNKTNNYEYNNECDNTIDNEKKEFNKNNENIHNIENNCDDVYKGACCFKEIDFSNGNKNSTLLSNNNEQDKKNTKRAISNEDFNEDSKNILMKKELNINRELNIQNVSLENNSIINEENKNDYIKEMGKSVTNLNYVNNIHRNNNNKNDLSNSSLECIDDKEYNTYYDIPCKENKIIECKNNENKNLYTNCYYELNEDKNKKENECNYIKSDESNIKNNYYNEIETNDNYMENKEDYIKGNYERNHELEMENECYDEDYEDNNFYDEDDSNSISHRNIIIINNKVTEKYQFNLKSSLKKYPSSERIKKTVSFSNYVYDLAKNNYELINLNSNDEISLSEEEKENKKFSYDDNINKFSTNYCYNVHNINDEDKTIPKINKNESNLKEKLENEEKVTLNDFQNKSLNDSSFNYKLNSSINSCENTREHIQKQKLCSQNVNVVEEDSVNYKHDLLADIPTNSKENYTLLKDEMGEELKENESIETHSIVNNNNILVADSSNEFPNFCDLKDNNDKGTTNRIINEELKNECVYNNKWKNKVVDHEEKNNIEYIKENDNAYLNIEGKQKVNINSDSKTVKVDYSDNIHPESCITSKTKFLSKEDRKSSIYNYKDISSCEFNEKDGISKNYVNSNISDIKSNTNSKNNNDRLSGVKFSFNSLSYPLNKKENINLSNNKNEIKCKKEDSNLNKNSHKMKKGLYKLNFFCNNDNSQTNDFVYNSINCVNMEEKEDKHLKKNENKYDEINNRKISSEDAINKKLSNEGMYNEEQYIEEQYTEEQFNEEQFNEEQYNEEQYNEEQYNEEQYNEEQFNEKNIENDFNDVHLENKYDQVLIDKNMYSEDANDEIKHVEGKNKMKNNIKRKSNNILTNKVNTTKISKLKSKMINLTHNVNNNSNNKYMSYENNNMKLVKNNKKDLKECKDMNKNDYFEYILLKKLRRNLKKNKECNYYEMRKIKNVLGFFKNNEVINMTKNLKLKSTINKKMKSKINKMQNVLKILKKNKNFKLYEPVAITKKSKRKYLKKEAIHLNSKSRQIKDVSVKINKSKFICNEEKNINITNNSNTNNMLLHQDEEIYYKQENNKKKDKDLIINKNVLNNTKKVTLTLNHKNEKKIKDLLTIDSKLSENNNCINKQNNLKRNLSEGNITKLKASNIGKKRSLSNKEHIINNRNITNDSKKNTFIKNDKKKLEKKKSDYQNKQMFMSCLSLNTLNKSYLDGNNKNEYGEKKITSNIKRNVSACTISNTNTNNNNYYHLNNYSKLKENDYFSDSDKVTNATIHSKGICKSNNISNYDYKNLCDAYNSCNDILEMEKQTFRINSLSFQDIKNSKKEELRVPSISDITTKVGKNISFKSASNNYMHTNDNNNIKECVTENICNEENENKSNQNFHYKWGKDTSDAYGKNIKTFDSIILKNDNDNNDYNNVWCDKYDKGYGSECNDEKSEMNHICNRLLKKKRNKILNEKKLIQLKYINDNNITNHSMKLNRENDCNKENINNLCGNKSNTFEIRKYNEKFPISRNSSIKNEQKSNDLIKKVNKKENEALCIYDINRSKQNNSFNNKALPKKYILSTTNNNNKKEKSSENLIIHNKEYNKNEKYGNNFKMRKIEDKKFNENENKIIDKVPLDKKKNNKSILLKKLQNDISNIKNDILNEKIRENKNLKICDENSDYSDSINYNETKHIMNILDNKGENINEEGCKYYLLNLKEKLKNNLKKKKHKKYINKIYKTMKYIFTEYNKMKKEKEDANKRNEYLKFLLENTIAKTNEMLRINKNSFQSYIDKMQKENMILKNELDEESYQHHYDLQQLVNKITNMEKIKDYIMYQNEEYNKKIIALALECDKLEKKKNELHSIVNEYKLNLEKEKKKKKYILRKVENSLKGWETDYNELKEKYNCIKDNNEELIKSNEELKHETLKLKEELYHKDVVINKKIEKINDLNMNYVSLKNDYKNNVSDNMYTNKTYDDLLSKYEAMEEFFKKNTEKLEKELLEKEKQIQIFEKEKKVIQDECLDVSKNVTTLKNKSKILNNYKNNDDSLKLLMENSINTIFKNLDNVEELKVNENLKNKIIDVVKNFMTNESLLKMYNCHNDNLSRNSKSDDSNIDNNTTYYSNNESSIELSNDMKSMLNEENLNNFNNHNKFFKNKKLKRTVIEEMKQILLSLEKKKKNSKYDEKIDELLSEKDMEGVKKLLKDNIINNKNIDTKKSSDGTPSESNDSIGKNNKKKKIKKNIVNHKEKMFNYDIEQTVNLKNKINELTELNKKKKIKILDKKVDEIKENYENDCQVIGICEDKKKKKDDDNKNEINAEVINIKDTFQNSKERYLKTKIRNLNKSSIKKIIKNNIRNGTTLEDTVNNSLDNNTQNEKYNDLKNNTKKIAHKENDNDKNKSNKNTQLKEIINNDFSSLQNEILTNKDEYLEGISKLNDTVEKKNINNDIKILLDGTKEINSNNLRSQNVNKNSKKKKKSFNAILDKIFDTPIDHSSINENMLNIQDSIENNIKNIFNTHDY
ncbi:regulator of chromosome condensation, putative [Plasmodium gallinaceum]|uniref:Regulator of chromosome condensation, putative n=1 Tax=Plasmodium gallinaceum TaxID=5849 RepID=A0A1J1GW16_PLAGA|nr:regulator of chromosome condensation, putative [Plasmodium gallinaceum]CRG96746.1 regulator of chromosome condensation, putative [Plasmodium gallinaceum]